MQKPGLTKCVRPGFTQKPQSSRRLRSFRFLLEFTLSCSFGFLLFLHAGFVVLFSLLHFRKNAGTRTRLLESTKSTVESLVLFHSDFCHFYPSLRDARTFTLVIIHGFCQIVKRKISFHTIFFRKSRPAFSSAGSQYNLPARKAADPALPSGFPPKRKNPKPDP